MKIQIDTNQKTVTVEDSINFKELFETLEKLFPDKEWEKYSLKSQVIQNWNYPIVIERERRHFWPNPIWMVDFSTAPKYGSGIQNETFGNSGIFNLELK